MKTFKHILMLSIMFIFSGVADAVPIPTSWTDTIDVNHRISVGSSFTFHLADFMQTTPDTGYGTIESATLDIDLWGFGRGTINIDDLQTERYCLFIFNDLDIPLSLEVVNNFNTTGELQITFDRINGCQWLDSLTLTANGYSNGPAPVPEPDMMLLLGTGFIGLAFYGRRRMKR